MGGIDVPRIPACTDHLANFWGGGFLFLNSPILLKMYFMLKLKKSTWFVLVQAVELPDLPFLLLSFRLMHTSER